MIRTLKNMFLPLALIFIGLTFTGAYFSSDVAISNMNFTTGSWVSRMPASSIGKATISEVFYHATDTNDTGLEWIELYNGGGSAIDLTGYDLYADGAGHYIIPSFSLSANATVVIHINTDGSDGATELYTGSGRTNMSNTRGSIAIFSSSTIRTSATIVDFVEYGTGGQSWQPAAVGAGIWTGSSYVTVAATGHSMELINKNSDTNQVSDWQVQPSPTLGV